MGAQMKDTLALSIGPHLAYQRFMESVSVNMFQMPYHMRFDQSFLAKMLNFIKSARSIPKGYKYYISESCYYYPAAARKLGRIDGKIIDLCASSIYYYILIKKIGGVSRKVLLNLLKDVDGFVFEGDFVGDVVRGLGIHKPSMTAYTYVKPERYETLLRNRPNLKAKNISITATNDYFYKGLDLVLEALRIVNESDPEITLTIAPNKDMKFDCVKHLLTDNVKINYDVQDMLKKTSLYVHPARGDVFPVAPLEAMLAGVPVMVSEATGTKEVVEKVREDYVTPIDSERIAEKITEYFSLNHMQRLRLSNGFRSAAKPFNEKTQVSDFKRKYEDFIRSV